MDDLNFNVDDIINDVNAKIKSAEKNEADEESVEAEPIADTENSSEACEQADNTDEKPQETPEATDDKPEPILAFHEDKSEEDKSEEDENKEPEKPEKQEKKSKSGKKKKKKRKKSKVNNSVFGGIILVIVILTVSLVLAVGGISIGMEYYGIGKTDEDIRFNIPAGSTNSEIADILVNEGVIKNKKLFMLALKFEKPAAIYPGDITLQPSSGYSEIIEKLSQMRGRKSSWHS